ncbi:MAG TPA: terminase family protein [Allosphingosinicella sp.]
MSGFAADRFAVTVRGLIRQSLAIAAREGCFEDVEWVLRQLSPPVRRGLLHDWSWQAHEGQAAPEGEWRLWLLMAGRGFGKTYAGAQWVLAQARAHPGARIALVGGSADEVAKVMVEGPSGLLALARPDEGASWVPTTGTLRFANGSAAFVYSAAAGEKLRGPEHHFAWADELAKWARADQCWDNLMMGLRLGARPRCVVTTTPRAVAVMQRLVRAKGLARSGGRTADNPHAEAAFVAWAEETYGGTRLGRQELDGILFKDVAGALFPRAVLEASRQSGTLPRMKRVVVGVDPPASADGDACGIVVCGLGADEVAYVLADCSVAGERPEGWARAVARAAEAWEADRVVAEKNQGGDMVASVLAAADRAMPVRLVSASRGKAARAEPVAARFETGKARLAGAFPALEDELAGLKAGGDYEGPGNSPDRADAMVWAMAALTGPPPPVPRVRGL